jgi:predicted nucleic acid-binding protein
VPGDADDDHVLACALAAHADWIVSGDAHLLNLKHFHGMRIIDAAEAVRSLAQ